MTITHPPLTLPADHLGLYVHVPFCARKCRYCDFASQPHTRTSALADAYLDALAREADARRSLVGDRPLHSVFIGGGTPTLLTGAQLRRLWHEVIAPFPRMPDVEITLEANPGTLTADVLEALAEIPLTRVSLGVQSFDSEELALLGRIHSPADVIEAVSALRTIGIPQLNLDLMYALPGQTAANWKRSLEQALALHPGHLSLYALILEEGTPLTAQVQAGLLPAPSEEEEEEMTEVTARLLADAGYRHYEVSNAARPGAHSRHNLGYWLGRDYLGLGVAATSGLGTLRWRNIDRTAGYISRMATGISAAVYAERLSAQERLLERVMLGLRLRDGFNLAEAETECRLAEITRGALRTCIDEGLLVLAGNTLRLTPAGYPLANSVVARLMAAHESAWDRRNCGPKGDEICSETSSSS
ncbi:MAG: radical SAM family heme chaperone HemW [Armatimonadota bacterium]